MIGRVCRRCGAEHEDLRQECRKCRSKRARSDKQRSEERRQAGMCVRCAKAQLFTATSCLRCYLRRLAWEATGKCAHWPLLARMWVQQKGRCYYTGVRMTLGRNASIDHILPRSRFPELEKHGDNICWCLTSINLAKGAETDTEFNQSFTPVCIGWLEQRGYVVSKPMRWR